MIPSGLHAVANHLWQSTLFAALAALLISILRRGGRAFGTLGARAAATGPVLLHRPGEPGLLLAKRQRPAEAINATAGLEILHK